MFEHLRKMDKWIERDDVWIKFLDRKGKLTVGYGSPGCIGPELEFGTVVGDRYDEQVLLIKPAWGGRSLYRDFPFAQCRNAACQGAAIKCLPTQESESRGHHARRYRRKPFGASYRAMLEKKYTAGAFQFENPFPGLRKSGLRDRRVRLVSGLERHD